MRLGYLVTKFPPIVGGGEIHMATIANEMVARGHVVEVITGVYPSRNFSAFPYRIHEILGLTDSCINFSAVAQITKLLEELDLDVLHIVNYECLLYYPWVKTPGWSRTRVVFSTHNTPLIGSRAFGGVGRYDIEKHAIQQVLYNSSIDKYIANSQAFAQGLQDMGVPQQVITLIPFGIDDSRFLPSKAPNNKIRNTGAVNLLCTSRFVNRKGIEHLIAAMGYLPDNYTLTLTGSGSVHDQIAYDRLMRLAGKCGSRINLAAAKVSLQDLVELYQTSDVFVMPSEYEGFGLAALEAMACATPVVATKVQGLEEFVVDGQTGVTVPYGQPLRPADAIHKVIANSKLRQKIIRNALTAVQGKYSFTRMAAAYDVLYDEAKNSAATERATPTLIKQRQREFSARTS